MSTYTDEELRNYVRVIDSNLNPVQLAYTYEAVLNAFKATRLDNAGKARFIKQAMESMFFAEYNVLVTECNWQINLRSNVGAQFRRNSTNVLIMKTRDTYSDFF